MKCNEFGAETFYRLQSFIDYNHLRLQSFTDYNHLPVAICYWSQSFTDRNRLPITIIYRLQPFTDYNHLPITIIYRLQSPTDHKAKVFQCVSNTWDVKSEDVAGRLLTVGDLQSIGGGKGFDEVAHHVDQRLLVQLPLSPDDRIVEEVELRGEYLALHDDLLTFGHGERFAGRDHVKRHVWKLRQHDVISVTSWEWGKYSEV